jgi:hypothetical protein
LIVRCGGYRYQTEPRTTTATRLARRQRVLGFLVVLPRQDPSDGDAVDLEPHLVRHAQHDLLVVEARDRPVQPARRDHAVAPLERAEHRFALALLLLLRTDQEEPEDREDRREEQELRDDGAGPASARRGRGGERDVSSVGEVHRTSSLRSTQSRETSRDDTP